MNYLHNIFPNGLLEHFNITGFKELGNVADKTMFYEIQLEENNNILSDFDQNLYESKGLTEVVLKDFPFRGKAVFLRFRLRRWRLKSHIVKLVRNDVDIQHLVVNKKEELEKIKEQTANIL